MSTPDKNSTCDSNKQPLPPPEQHIAPIVVLDLDGVLLNTVGAMIPRLQDVGVLPEGFTERDWDDWYLTDYPGAMDHLTNHIFTDPAFWAGLEEIEGAAKWTQSLRSSGVEVAIVTHRPWKLRQPLRQLAGPRRDLAQITRDNLRRLGIAYDTLQLTNSCTDKLGVVRALVEGYNARHSTDCKMALAMVEDSKSTVLDISCAENSPQALAYMFQVLRPYNKLSDSEMFKVAFAKSMLFYGPDAQVREAVGLLAQGYSLDYPETVMASFCKEDVDSCGRTVARWSAWDGKILVPDNSNTAYDNGN